MESSFGKFPLFKEFFLFQVFISFNRLVWPGQPTLNNFVLFICCLIQLSVKLLSFVFKKRKKKGNISTVPFFMLAWRASRWILQYRQTVICWWIIPSCRLVSTVSTVYTHKVKWHGGFLLSFFLTRFSLNHNSSAGHGRLTVQWKEASPDYAKRIE